MGWSEVNLTDHFSLEELIFSEIAARKGLDNTPSPSIIEALRHTAQGLERIRGLVGKPIHVNSGYRSPEVNAAVGGQPTSQHMKGEAADITCKDIAPKELALLIAENRMDLSVDQVILEFGQWTHVSFTENPRHAVLTIEGTKTGIA